MTVSCSVLHDCVYTSQPASCRTLSTITRECSALWGEPEQATEVCCRLSLTVENGTLSLGVGSFKVEGIHELLHPVTKEPVCNCWILVDCLDTNRWSITVFWASLCSLCWGVSLPRDSLRGSWSFMTFSETLTNVVRTCLTKCLF